MKSEYLLCRFDCYCIVSRICWLSSKINQQTKSTVLDFCLIFVKIICRAFRQFLIRHPFPRHQFADMYPGYWPSYCYFQNNTFYQQGFVSVVILIFNSCIVFANLIAIRLVAKKRRNREIKIGSKKTNISPQAMKWISTKKKCIQVGACNGCFYLRLQSVTNITQQFAN